VLLVPPLEQPRLPLVPAGVWTTTLKLPGPAIMEDVMLTVSWELLVTVVTRVTPLKITTEEETKWLPEAVRTKLGGNFAKTIVAGEIEPRMGAGRALPQRGFSVLHPVRSKSTRSHDLRSTTRKEGSIN
jgi:hypothetical protein